MPGEVKINKGIILPDATAVRTVIKKLQTDLAADDDLAARFAKNPRMILGERGLPLDVQVELLKEAGKRFPGAAGKCDYTCICTGCSFTKNAEFGKMINPAFKVR